jgi:magnesium-transporting ATPase (P-type)
MKRLVFARDMVSYILKYPWCSEQAESGLRFLGLVIFENKLKPGTAPAIQALRTAHLACRMITGDNPLTAVSVARECSLVNQAAYIFSPVFIRGSEVSLFLHSIPLVYNFSRRPYDAFGKIRMVLHG